jgi:ribonuclease D
MSIFYYRYDLPDSLSLSGDLAIDTEAMGLNNHRDRLCVVQISNGDGNAHIVHFPTPNYEAPNLKKLLSNQSTQKIFHFARFDVAIISHYLDIELSNIFCTKISSYLCRTYTDQHGLKELCNAILGIKLNKEQRSTDWGTAEDLKDEQLAYAANDVLYLHQLKEHFITVLERENRLEIAQKCFDFLPTRAKLDLAGWNEFDIFQH